MADVKLNDPLGREVVLHDRTWYGHIVKGHPEITGDRTLVEEAVTTPDEIRQSNSDADCRLYFAPGPRPAVKMMVVVDVSAGVVKTAHLAKRVSGGALEWSK